MKRLIDRIVIRQFPDLNEDLILVTNRTHFSDSLKAHLNDLHVKAVFDNMPGKYGREHILAQKVIEGDLSCDGMRENQILVHF